MPSAFTHAYSAIALGFITGIKERRKLFLLGAVCSILPDADAIGFHMGVPYASMWGHRGITHSFFFAVLLAILVMILFYRNTKSLKHWAGLFLYFAVATALHPLLDALTSGGLGVAFFAPFDNERYFFPYRPIKVSPISISRFFSGRGLDVFKSELMWVWLPATILMIPFIRGRKK
jgi:inner membrane protein